MERTNDELKHSYKRPATRSKTSEMSKLTDTLWEAIQHQIGLGRLLTASVGPARCDRVRDMECYPARPTTTRTKVRRYRTNTNTVATNFSPLFPYEETIEGMVSPLANHPTDLGRMLARLDETCVSACMLAPYSPCRASQLI